MVSVDNNDDPVIEKLLEHYELYARAAGFSQAQINIVRICLKLFDRFLGEIRDIGEVTAKDFRRFLAELRTRPVWQGLKTEQQRNLSNATINTYARTVKTFFRWLKNESFIAENPLESVQTPPIGERMSKAYSEDQMSEILKVASLNTRDKSILYLFIDSGLRLDELSKLKIGNVDLKNSRAKVLGKGKGKKERYIYLGPHAVEAIGDYIKESRREASNNDFLFVKGDGKPLTNSGIRSMLVRLGERLGFQGRLSPHRLRHTFATISLNYGATREELQKEMGHSNPETTEGYLHVPDSDIGAAHQQFSPLSNLLLGRVAKDLPDKLQSKTSKYYEETPHMRKMRELTRILAGRISIPSVWDKELLRDIPLDFKPGKYNLSFGLTEINKDKHIKVKYHDISSGIAEPHLIKGVFSHISTSGLPRFRELIGDKGKIDILRDEASSYSENLLKFLKLILDSFVGTGTTVLFSNDQTPGLKEHFIITVWIDAIQKAGGHTWIDDMWYKPPEVIPDTELLQLRCGAYIIGIAATESVLKTYEKLHKDLRGKYAKDPSARDISIQSERMSKLIQDIRQRLLEFSDFECLPGNCELCDSKL